MKITTLFSKTSEPADLLAVGCFEGHKPPQEIAAKKFSGKSGETAFVPSGTLRAGRNVLLVGLGKKEKFTLEKIRQAAAKALAYAKSMKVEEARFDLESFSGDFGLDEAAAAAVEGARLSDYRFEKYKSKPAPSSSLAEFGLYAPRPANAPSIKKAVREAEIVCEGVYFTRDLANEPANVMTPARLAESARQMAAKNNLSCQILGLAQMKRLKMGGILGVSQGSVNPPRFIILQNKVKRSKKPIVLVGKGVTFDTGGISIKPSGDMDKMKFDMCGAAAVIGAMKVIANLKLPVKVIGLVPTCENMPSGSAQRPGDIITCLNGKTVEVLNTDAEGRLILADALSYAKRFNPRALVDIATLTGACAATFADLASGLMSTDEDLAGRIKEAGESSGERVWELPLWDEYFDLIKAAYADIQNISKKYAGTITAGMFLKEFADHTSAWAHLDIAGTAWNEGVPKPLSPIGATGMGVRLFTRLVQGYSR